MKTCNVEDARKRFAEVIADAQGAPLVLTRYGKPVAVLLGAAHANLESLEATMKDLLVLASKRRRS
jgi:prevent-host-death family protein